ncbi:cytochrome c3 family protein [Candidatus Thiodiazotropha sp. CDECU1]|uniref:cytochrome c3 family protein n=1 Tax=Candidatus Thiodiazotropha sp. CDECU1 TaxID=3065865 RepID=UPI0029319F29|nr:cytochrome c3 family protein [Candidatus Thiodiazotropha sp. CDECU1]
MPKVFLLFILLVTASNTVHGGVADTLHNLSTSGPGLVKSQTEDRICIFCHTPHASAPDSPLWNRSSSGVYIDYQSSTKDAEAGVMSSSSVLCLSCHDGTIALGNMINPGVTNDLGNTFITGRSLVGTDLSDDHPVSIFYNPGLLTTDPDLAHPNNVDLPLRNNELHCSSCHDAHENIHPPFLHKSTLNGELCTTCHLPSGTGWNWTSSSHATSNATPQGTNPWPERKPEWTGLTVQENACMNCHAPHNATTPERLIKDSEEDTCYLCHNGTVSQADILAEQQKFYHHPVEQTPNIDHDSARIENPLTMSLHVECEDCHNPHASFSSPPMISFNPNNPLGGNHSTAPFINGSMAGVTGIDINGGFKPEADYEYEVCFKCHGIPGKSACDTQRCSTANSYNMVRADGIYNIRDKVNSGNPSLVSYHPIEINNPLNNSEVPSLRNDIPLTTISGQIYCNDCHSSNSSPAAGGVDPTGPHGSTYEGILAQAYDFDPVNATTLSNDLCFKCHDSGNLYTDQSFPHNEHVINNNLGCINCHDPHGSASSPHLINFLTSSNIAGQVRVITGAGDYVEPTWIDAGVHNGSCWLTCHGEVHNGFDY